MTKTTIWACVFFGGWAGLTWELIWLHHASLTIGVTAQATAVVLISVMLGMAAGAIIAGRYAQRWQSVQPLKVYALLELCIGLCGIGLALGFFYLRALDGIVFQWSPALTTAANALGCLVLLGLPAAAMGATIPVFAQVARQYGFSISTLYGANIAGATSGILLTSFVVIPAVGFKIAAALTSSLNILLALVLIVLAARAQSAPASSPVDHSEPARQPLDARPFWISCAIAACTGFATFSLEIAWFRSIRSAFQATSESFALMLGSVLLALFLGSVIAPTIRRHRPTWLVYVLLLSGLFVLISTPLVERIDLFLWAGNSWSSYTAYNLTRFLYLLIIIGIPMTLIGISLPWLLDSYRRSRTTAIVYASNTVGAVLGSLVSAWLLLPSIGFVKTAWVAALVLFVPVFLIGSRTVMVIGALSFLAGIAISQHFESGIGKVRVQAPLINVDYSVIDSSEGPDSTVSVIESADGMRALFIDGFMASSTHLERGANSNPASYMESMGQLPMVLHRNPEQALVICFGTGQTANQVRLANPQQLDIIDISPDVFQMADHFEKNQKVLLDPRVKHFVMDGRQWLRRVSKTYDVITLEPMPPTFAGTNNLYSREFYQLARQHLNEEGMMAQWLPFHLVSPRETEAIVATFTEVFPDSQLWIESISGTGILLGRKSAQEHDAKPWKIWTTELRIAGQSLTLAQFRGSFARPSVMRHFAGSPLRVTDDNQMLSYGYGRSLFIFADWANANQEAIRAIPD